MKHFWVTMTCFTCTLTFAVFLAVFLVPLAQGSDWSDTKLLLLEAEGPAVDGRCRNALDCQLNGMCVQSVCVCDAAWTGTDCAMLQFLPAVNHVAFHGANRNSTSWGGSVISEPTSSMAPPSGHGKNELDNNITYVMYVSEMVNNCGLRDWKTNSAVVAATSMNPDGPYVRQKKVISTWAHNPQAIQVKTKDEEGKQRLIWAIFTLGDGDGKPVNGPVKDCTTFNAAMDAEPEHTPGNIDLVSRHLLNGEDPPVDMSNATVHFTIHYSTKSSLGPFLKHVAAINDFPLRFDFPGNWNPAPVVLPDGRVRIMVHTNYPKHWSGGIVVEAPNWMGPYHPITSDVTYCTECQEDPFMWTDHRGNWHALYHRMFDPIKTDEQRKEDEDEYYLYDNYDGHRDKNKPNPIPSPGWVGGHAFSVDGVTWSNITRCYNTTVKFEDGSAIEMKRRERPKLIFDPSDGVTPTHLVNGVSEEERGTYTLVTPLKRPD
jgi:hypothetical protein